jgi:hypothetical protein
MDFFPSWSFYCNHKDLSSKLVLQTMGLIQTPILLHVNTWNNKICQIQHFKLQQNHSQYTYSTCIIQNILHPFDWKQPLHQTIQFLISYHVKIGDSIACSYWYWDYQQAWFKALFSKIVKVTPGYSISIPPSRL